MVLSILITVIHGLCSAPCNVLCPIILAPCSLLCTMYSATYSLLRTSYSVSRNPCFVFNTLCSAPYQDLCSALLAPCSFLWAQRRAMFRATCPFLCVPRFVLSPMPCSVLLAHYSMFCIQHRVGPCVPWSCSELLYRISMSRALHVGMYRSSH